MTAKLATGFAKSAGKGADTSDDRPGAPEGMFRLTAANWAEIMAHRPTNALWGIGNRIAARLAELGIHTVGDLMAADRARLAAEFGPANGPYLWVLGRGAGDTEVVTTPPPVVGHSRSRTFPRDLFDHAEIRAEVVRLAGEVTEEIAATGRTAVRVAVTVRTATFYTRSKQSKLPNPTADVAAITDTALRVLERFPLDRPVRLLGVRLELAPLENPALDLEDS
ncbi:DinB/UmuC family translesion DNA polymerase [Nocardia sp. X0981]